MSTRILIMASILILAILASCSTPAPSGTKESQDVKFRCASASDCTSTCGMGCVNAKWARSYKDPCVNVRAFECTCNANTCFTDSRAPKI